MTSALGVSFRIHNKKLPALLLFPLHVACPMLFIMGKNDAHPPPEVPPPEKPPNLLYQFHNLNS